MSAITGQSAAYWDQRFGSRHWANNGGNYQSVLFMNAILDVILGSELRPHFAEYSNVSIEENGMIGFKPCTIIDYGCAEGDGTAVIQSRFPMARVIGMDWSTHAVYRARERWPTLEFEWGDIENPAMDADIIITSHTIEHLTDPVGAINALLARCAFLVVGVPPVSTDEKGGHDGAVPFDEWRPRTTPVFETGFNTVRMVRGEPWAEGTSLLVYQGLLTQKVPLK